MPPCDAFDCTSCGPRITCSCRDACSLAPPALGKAALDTALVRMSVTDQPKGKRRRGSEAVEDVMRSARACGLLGPLGLVLAVQGTAGVFMTDMITWASGQAALAWDLPRLHTALRWFLGFLQAGDFPKPYAPFVPALERAGQICNRALLDAFVAFIRRSVPIGNSTKAEHVSIDVARAYGSVIRTLRSREARYDVAPIDTDLMMPLVARTCRRADPPASERRLTRALRASHLLLAALAGLDLTSPQGLIDWAGALTALNLMLRGGEWGIPDGIDGDPRRILTWNSFVWRESQPESRNRPWILAWVHKIKDLEARAKPFPSPIARRHDGKVGADVLCPYDALAIAWWSRRAPPGTPFPTDEFGRPADRWWTMIPAHASAPPLSSPFFTTGGAVYTTSAVRNTVQRIAAAAGLDPSEFGAKSPRSGGATEYRAAGKPAEFVKARGRWSSDIAEIYQRELLSTHIDASASIGPSGSADLEAVCAGWAQPTR